MRDLGFPEDEALDIVEESFPPARVFDGARIVSFATTQLFRRSGVLDDAGVLGLRAGEVRP